MDQWIVDWVKTELTSIFLDPNRNKIIVSKAADCIADLAAAVYTKGMITFLFK